jgi:hypothetical protein
MSMAATAPVLPGVTLTFDPDKDLARKIQQGVCAAWAGSFICTGWLRRHAEIAPR